MDAGARSEVRRWEIGDRRSERLIVFSPSRSPKKPTFLPRRLKSTEATGN
jgi:hypothetical protein